MFPSDIIQHACYLRHIFLQHVSAVAAISRHISVLYRRCCRSNARLLSV